MDNDKKITVGYVLNTVSGKDFVEVCEILDGVNKKDVYVNLTSNQEEYASLYIDLINAFFDLYQRGIIEDCKNINRVSHLLDNLASTIRSVVYLSHGVEVDYFDIFICVDKTGFDANLARALNGYTFI